MNNSNVVNLQNIRNDNQNSELDTAIRSALSQYLDDLDGEAPGNVYDLVIQQVEAPLLELILAYVDGNQSKAAEYLGINRGTLRKKLKIYQLIK
ncbi:DNA-binding protein Fis [hydrothermal vent metagenome]|uniref:Putative Fis-like DNA-binding protein n=1 Tax=hydrothermal vent metagenome TaxID=652676 RepID=A0A3B0XMG6_9ZZZZ